MHAKGVNTGMTPVGARAREREGGREGGREGL